MVLAPDIILFTQSYQYREHLNICRLILFCDNTFIFVLLDWKSNIGHKISLLFVDVKHNWRNGYTNVQTKQNNHRLTNISCTLKSYIFCCTKSHCFPKTCTFLWALNYVDSYTLILWLYYVRGIC